MKRLALIRFGGVPNQDVTRALQPHIDLSRSIAFPIPGAVMSIFDTDADPAQIAADVRAVGVQFILCPFDPKTVELPAQIMSIIREKMDGGSAPTQAEGPSANTELEAIIAKMREQGEDSLTPEEKEILRQSL